MTDLLLVKDGPAAPEGKIWVETKDRRGKVKRRDLVALHKCTTCGGESPWGPSWKWFGSYRDLDNDEPIMKFCSDSCAEVAVGRGFIPKNAPKMKEESIG
jgi:endogenous inhibitor of DNA gyrase (YacG/DUF329 family)